MPTRYLVTTSPLATNCETHTLLQRIIDNVPQTIDLVFLKALSENLMPFLISKLALGTADSNTRCTMYLAEDPVLVARRRELKARKERLEEVQMALQSFGISSQ